MPNEKMKAFFTKCTTALTFDDVLLDADYADFSPDEVDLTGKFSRNVSLRTPLVGAAMSSVVGPKMAIALAKAGGIASIPRNLDPESQAKAAAKVKHHIHGFIDEPIHASAVETVADLLKRREDKGWEFDSFPVIDIKGALVGLMTHHNFKRCDDPTQQVGGVMTPLTDLVTANEGITKQDAYQTLKDCDKNVLPVLRKNQTLAGIYIFSDLKRILTEKTDHNVDQSGRLRVCAAIGVGDEALVRAELLIAKGVDVLHIDMAHGHQRLVLDTLKKVRARHRDAADLVSGNVINGQGTCALIEAGTDGVLCGIGGGAICTTRPVTGVGKPQLTAVWECAEVARGSGVPVCSDGGTRYSGDAMFAHAAGASCAMLGSVFAGTDETPGEKYLFEGVYWKDFYGMGSIRAMHESAGSRQRYLQTQKVLVPEGIEGQVRYRGPVINIVEQMIGGMRKGFHYTGSRNLEELHEKACFIQVTQAGRNESHPHDIRITTDSPNYSGRS